MKRGGFLLYFCVLLIKSVYSSVPSAMISIYPHPSGTFTVNINLFDEKCTENDLKKIVYKIGRTIKEEPRGLLVYLKQNQIKKCWCARFAIKNIVFNDPSLIKLQEITQGFCSCWSSKQTEKGKIVIYISDIKAHSKLIKYYNSADVQVIGTAHSRPLGIEYTIDIHHVKENIFIPEKAEDKKIETAPTNIKNNKQYFFLIISLSSIGLSYAFYRLVYFIKRYVYKNKK